MEKSKEILNSGMAQNLWGIPIEII